MSPSPGGPDLPDEDYRRLASFRHALRQFLRFSEQAARAEGLTPNQHQLMLAVRGWSGPDSPTITELADQLQLKVHSTSELVQRAVASGMVEVAVDTEDHRRQHVELTPEGDDKLRSLSVLHRDELRRFRTHLADLVDPTRLRRHEQTKFDLVVRFLPEFRQDVESIGNILVSTPDGARIPLKQVATITTQTGAFIIYRENNERYIPIKFSVRDRDLQSTVEEAQARMAKEIVLPERYRMEWAGQYDQLKDEQKRLAKVVPVSLLIVLFLLYTTFNSLKNALLVLATVPFALVGGVLALVLTNTHFSISAAVGVISTLGVAILGGVLLISRIEEFRQAGSSLREAVSKGADAQMRPILMATLGAAIGLLPAALATGIGSQAQKPLARVVVGGMLTAAFLILVVLPVLYEVVHQNDSEAEDM